MTRRQIEDALRGAGIEDSGVEAKLLFSHFSGLSPAAMMAEPGAECNDPALQAAVARRLLREPLGYILGEVCFFGETYRVSPACLIPRGDTERLVETAIDMLPNGALFADFCTGSGCIAISVLAHRPDCRAVAFDISEDALALARENAGRNGVAGRVEFVRSDLLSDPAPHRRGDFAAILSNPPYLTEKDLETPQPEITHEPRQALAGGADGLVFYRHFLAYATHGCPFIFEIGAEQGGDIRSLAAAYGYRAEVTQDYEGRDRVAVLTKIG